VTGVSLLVLADDDTARELSGYVRQALLLEQEYLRSRGRAIPAELAALEVVTPAGGLPATGPMVGRWLTLTEAARHARVTVRTLARWRADGLPSTGHGARVRIDRAELDAYLGRSETTLDAPGHAA
jgi:excisionase family DNA binding protein